MVIVIVCVFFMAGRLPEQLVHASADRTAAAAPFERLEEDLKGSVEAIEAGRQGAPDEEEIATGIDELPQFRGRNVAEQDTQADLHFGASDEIDRGVKPGFPLVVAGIGGPAVVDLGIGLRLFETRPQARQARHIFAG